MLTFAAVAVLLSACEQTPLDPFTPPSDLASLTAPAPATSTSPVVTTENYGRIETFKSASPGYSTPAGKINGLTMTSGKANAAETGAAQAPGNKNELVSDTRSVVGSGGTAVITVTGHTDSLHSNTNNALLSLDRAKVAAQELKKDLGLDAKVVGNASLCGAAKVCIVYRADPRASSNANVGRAASATATFTSSGGGGSGGGGGSSGGGGGGSSGGSGGGSGDGDLTGGSEPISEVVPVLPGSPAYFDYYPGADVPTEDIALRVKVAIDDVFRTGGTLVPETVRVVAVDVTCRGVPCSFGAAPRVQEFAADWKITVRQSGTTTDDKYPLCASSTSRSCAFFVLPSSVKNIDFPGNAPANALVLGFISPTPTEGFVRPTIDVTAAKVALRLPTWVGGAGCDAATPPERCWTFSDSRILDVPVSVVTTGGEAFARSGDVHYLDRRVVGSIGS